MKKNLNPKKLLSCALLMLGGISSLHAATLKVKVIADGQPLNGVQVKLAIPFSSTTGSGINKPGEVETTVLDNTTYSIALTYNDHTYVMSTNSGVGTKTETVSMVKLQSPNTEFQLQQGGSWHPGGVGEFAFPNTYNVKINGTYYRNVAVTGTVFNKVPVVILVNDHNGNAILAPTFRGGYGNIPKGGSFSWNTLSTATDANGTTIEWLNAGTKMCSYEAKVNGTIDVQSQDVSLTNGNVFNFKTSQLTLKLKDCAGNGIAGGSARYGIGTNSTAMFFPGLIKTATDGTMSMEAFPGTYSFEMGINQSIQAKQIVFDGTNGLCFTTTKVAINWPYNLAYGGAGGNAYFPNKAGTEMLPGTWNFRFDGPAGQTFAPITISGCSINKSAVIVRLINSNGAPIANAQPYLYSQNVWGSIPVTNAAGNSVALVDANPGVMYSRMSYMGGLEERIQDMNANPIVTYKTTRVTMDFKNSDGVNSSAMEGSNLKFYSDSWRTFGTGETVASSDAPTTAVTTGGVAKMELLPVTYYFRLSYMGGTQEIIQNVAAKDTVCYKTTQVTMDFKNSNGENSSAMEGSNLKFYSNSWRTFGTGEAVASSDAPTAAVTTGGVATMELLPLTYYFRLSYMGGTQEIIQNVAAEKTVSYKTTAVTMDFKNSYGLNSINMEGSNLKFYSNSWRTFGTGETVASADAPTTAVTTGGLAKMELLPLTYYFRLSYMGATQEIIQNVAADSSVKFRTRSVVVYFRTSKGKKLTADELQFYSDKWRPFIRENNGHPTVELLPLTYYFHLSYMGATQEIIQNIAADSSVQFRTTPVSMRLDGQDAVDKGATDLKFYSDKWRPFIRENNGNPTMELLPLPYYFRLSYRGSTLETQQNVAANNNVVSFVTASTMRKTASTLATTEVSFYPNPAISNLHVSMPAAGTVEIFSIEGKKLAQYEVAEGTATIDISSIPAGNHVMIVHYGDHNETFKFVKL